jgi:hypothetical protein
MRSALSSASSAAVSQQIAPLYPKDLVGKTFDEYLVKKYKYQQGRNLRPDQLKKAQQEYRGLLQKALDQQKDALDRLYQNAFSGGAFGSECEGFLVLGSKGLRDSPDELRNLLPLTDAPHENGAVFAPRKWSVLKNDMMLLGAIHAQKPCMIFCRHANPQGNGDSMVNVSDVWDEEHDKPRIFGRELAILQAAGYAPLSHSFQQSLGIVLVCANPEKASRFTLEDVCKAADAIHTPEKILKIFEKSVSDFYSDWKSY